MKAFLRLSTQILMLSTLVIATGCNKKYVYHADKVQPCYAEMIILDEAYDDWSISFENLRNDYSNNCTVWGEMNDIQGHTFQIEKGRFDGVKLITYQNQYVSLSYKIKGTEQIYVSQLYGEEYRYTLKGMKNESYQSQRFDINLHQFTLYEKPADILSHWYLNISRYNPKKDMVSGVFKAQANTQEAFGESGRHYNWFYLRRVVQDDYFAINLKTPRDGQSIKDYYKNNYSYSLVYITAEQERVF